MFQVIRKNVWLMTNRERAKETYRIYSDLEGNQHIASQFALEKVLDLIELNNPKKILELGLGIGSISHAVFNFLKNKSISCEYFGTEANEYCLSQLRNNLGEFYHQLNLFPSLEKIPSGNKFDLIIIDGKDDSLIRIADLISKNGVLFIEGDRLPQQSLILDLFPKALFVHLISDFRNPEYGLFPASSWSGGGKLIYSSPNSTQKLNWAFEKVRSSLRARISRRF